MNSFEWLVALRYLRAKKKEGFISLITFISIAGVAVGVMALIVVIAVMAGFENHLRTKILGITAHVIVRSYNNSFDDVKVLEKKIKDIKLPEGNRFNRFIDELFGRPSNIRVTAITPFVYIQALLSTGSAVSGALIRGVDPNSVSKVISIGEVVSGEGLSALKDYEPGTPAPILIGKQLAKSLGLFVGENIQIIIPTGTISPIGMLPKIRTVHVVGIISTGMYEYDASLAFIPIKAAQELMGLDNKIQGLEMKVSDIYGADKIAKAIQEKLGFPFWVTDWQRMSRNLFSALKLEKLAMFIILTLIVLVAAFNIISTLIMTVMEKNKDIAILKAIGATDKQILRIFIYNGFLVGLIGTLIGTISGISICELLKKYKFIKIPQDVYYTNTLPILLNTSDVIIIATSAILICFLATLYPAHQAAKINPATALRTG